MKNGTGIKDHNSGMREWFLNHQLHRDNDLPAVEYKDGGKEWWVNGQRHRIGKPAVKDADGLQEWWVDDKLLSKEEVENWLKENKINLKSKEGQMAFKLRWG